MPGAGVDELDVSILRELSADSSVSVPRLSERIGANPSVVYSRIKRLVRNRLIEGYTIKVNGGALGYGVKAVTGIKMDTNRRDHIIDELFRIDGVAAVSEVTGRFDMLVTMYSESLDQMHKVVSERIGRIDGVLSSESFVEMKSRAKAMPYMRSGSGDD